MKSLSRIEKYQFGKMIISGHTYTCDLIIYSTGRIKDGWFRKNGHLLLPDDIQTILESPPDILIIGKGASGRMAVDPTVIDRLKAFKIETIMDHTAAATDKYNQTILTGQKVAGCFHLTC